MANVAMIGTGMMGSGFVEAMLRNGESVAVWNRTIEKTAPLVELGARAFGSPAEAVAGADRVHIMLGDDASVDGILHAIAPHLAPETIVIDHTTVTPKGTLARFAWCDERAIAFIHAPVFMSPQGCTNAKGLMLASAPASRFAQVRDALEKMTGELWYLGERPDKAAALKLCGNMLLFFMVAGLADVFALAGASGIDATEAHELFSHFNIANSVNTRGGAMARGDYTSVFDLTMARKDVRLMLETAADGDAGLAILPRIGERMDAFIARGLGAADVGVIASDAVRTAVPLA